MRNVYRDARPSEGTGHLPLALRSSFFTRDPLRRTTLRIRFAAPATAERIWELMTMDKWTITYKGEDKIEDARISFDKPGVCKAYKP